MKYSMRNLAIALGFFSISIFPSYFSMLMRTFEVGGSSVRAGLIISVVFFFLMVIPFGVRYFGTPKIILSNIFVFLIIIFTYIFSSLIFPEVDHTRFLLSLALLFTISFASNSFISSVDLLKDEYFNKMIFAGFYFLICIGYVVYIRKFHFGYIPKDFILFTEASHYALTFAAFLLYASYNSLKKYSILFILASVFLALSLQSLTLLVACFIAFFITFGSRIWIMILLILIVLFSVIYFDMSYYLDRLSFLTATRNSSTLVLLSGWERAYLAFFDSFGFGVGFQQIGIVGPQGNLQDLLMEINRTSKGYNWNDGGTLAAKLVVEFGLFGLILLMLYFYHAVKIVKLFLTKKIKNSKNIFFFGLYLVFSMELFVRGMGYFSVTSFMFIASIYWMYRNQILQRQL
jgi:hypothetical protein